MVGVDCIDSIDTGAFHTKVFNVPDTMQQEYIYCPNHVGWMPIMTYKLKIRYARMTWRVTIKSIIYNKK